ncbi:VOC family protein [Alsobacter sp. KACC 23698]|uniref:VOC family protein n=1 Tax=Alsobacter sp. KACC 23698 TaxID=3149229 RepID=A0AAU7JLT4_9HYPH
MLDHVSITVSDLRRAERFYDAVMTALGVAKVGASDVWLGYGQRCDADHPGLTYLAIKPGPEPEPAHGRHWCFKAPSRAAVDAFWAAGLGAGGSDDGPPGLRTQYHPSYYAAFLADPDGNRVEAVCHLGDP